MKTREEIEDRLRGLEARQMGLSINTIIKRGAMAQTLRWVLSTTEPGITEDKVEIEEVQLIGELPSI